MARVLIATVVLASTTQRRTLLK